MTKQDLPIQEHLTCPPFILPKVEILVKQAVSFYIAVSKKVLTTSLKTQFCDLIITFQGLAVPFIIQIALCRDFGGIWDKSHWIILNSLMFQYTYLNVIFWTKTLA